MSAEYKFILGRQRVSTDLLSGLTPTIVTNTKQWTGSVLKRGKWYETVFTQAIDPLWSFAPLDAIGVGVQYGTNGFGSRWYPGVDGDFRYENICLEDGELWFIAGFSYSFTNDPYTISGEELYELDWNDPLTSDPKDWNTAKMSIERESDDFTQVTKYIGSLTFVDDGYDYLLTQFNELGRETRVPVRIERRDKNGNYQMLTEGEIYLADCKFNLSRGQVQVSIEATDAAVLLDKGKDVKISALNATFPIGVRPVWSALPFNKQLVTVHDVNGVYSAFTIVFFSLYEHLRSIIIAMSDGRVELYSEFLETWNDQVTNGGDWLMIFKGMPGVSGFDYYIQSSLSFSELFKALDGVFNLGVGFEVRNGIQTIRIEPKSYWQGLTPTVVTLDRVADIEASFPSNIGFREIRIGYNHKFNSSSGTDEEDVFNYSSDNKNAETILDKTNDFIIDSGWIYEMVTGVSTPVKTDVDNSWFFVLCEQDPGGVRSKITGGTGDYNGPFVKEVIFPTYFKDTFLSDNYGADEGETGAGLLNFKRLLKFSYPLTLKQFQDLQRPEGRVLVSGAGLPVAVSGVAIHVDRANESGLTEFEVLAE